MKRTAAACCVALFTLAGPGVASAGLFRAYLSLNGNDAFPCTLQQPCRLLPAALAAVADEGEIWILDSANYNTGPVNVMKSVTVLAMPGVQGSIVAAGGNAMDIATAGVKVTLRNLVIIPLPGGGGLDGIHMTAGAMLTVENCEFANLPQSAIFVSGAITVRVADTIARDSGDTGLLLVDGARAVVTRGIFSGNAGSGVVVRGNTAGTTTSADIGDSTIDNDGSGVFVLSTNASAIVKASVRDSRVVRNTDFGVAGDSLAGAPMTISVSNDILSNNNVAIAMLTTGKAWVAGNTVSDNGTGLQNSGGVFETDGNNAVRNNATDTSGTITAVPTK